MARKQALQKKPQRHQITKSEDWHEVFAIALAGVALLGLLALISYVPEDFPPWHEGRSGAGLKNFVGPVGVLAAGGALFVLGAAAYLVPLVALAWAGALLRGRGRVSWASGMALLAWLLSACCILEYQNLCFGEWVERYALPGSKGGLIGAVLGQRWLAGALGEAGASVFVFLLYVLSLTVGTGFRSFRRLSMNWKPVCKKADRQTAPRLPCPTTRRPHHPGPAEPETAQSCGEAGIHARRRKEVAEVAAEPPGERLMPQQADVQVKNSQTEPLCHPATVRQTAFAMEGHPSHYQFPPLGLLTIPEPRSKGRTDLESLRSRQSIIVETLKNFRVRVEPGEITEGPSVTRFEFYPERGLSVRRIAALEADIALATRAKRITILAPIPGKDTVGIELANEQRVAVGLRELLQAGAFADAKAQIPLALGKDVYGKVLVADLAAMPHLLIAGATGSGKSVCLNTIIASLLYRFQPDRLRMIMIDPKVVEMQVYARLPHLAVPVVTETKKVLAALRWCLHEMERRYRLFAEAAVRKLDEYNAKALQEQPVFESTSQGELFQEEDYFLPGNQSRGEPFGTQRKTGREVSAVKERLPRIVVIIDELADLMQAAPADVETCICRLCQKARAAGIHLIVATQSPRAEVITGLIKANIPARIAFQVSSGTDSRVILDKSGAERLVGKGDLLFQPPDSPVMVRAQGAFLSDEEVERLVDHCGRQAKPEFDHGIRMALESDATLDALQDVSEEDEDTFQKALELIREEKRASTSFLQRRMRLGYTRAARLMDLLEERGVVGPAEGARPREILVADPDCED